MKQAIVFIVIVILLFLPAKVFAISDHIEYNITVSKDGSASWKIIQVTDINSSVDSWEEFEQRLLFTIDMAREHTNREMALDYTSLEMSTEIHWDTSSKTIMYVFHWLNFSIVKQGQISFGDVFNQKFFTSLYGDGELYVVYPPEYHVGSVSFGPDERDDSTQMLHWYRTQDFLVADQNVSLETLGTNSNGTVNPLVVAVLGVGGLSAAAIGIFIFRNKRGQKESLLKSDERPSWQKVESDQDKILQLLQFSGGNLKQSEVCNKLRFSRAKTSLLLTEMEKNSLVKRYKKGKNKIIFSVENKEGRNL
jgi:hypothetical protein